MLDKMFINGDWAEIFHTNQVNHLGRTGSDHRPLLTNCHNEQQVCIKYFKFLDI